MIIGRQDRDGCPIADVSSMTPVLLAHLHGLMRGIARARIVTPSELDLDPIPHLELVERDLLLLGLALTLGLARLLRLHARLADLGSRCQPDEVDVVPHLAR